MMMIQDSKTSFCCSKFPCIRESASLKVIDNLGQHSQKGSPPWPRDYRILKNGFARWSYFLMS
jgi:hypothetical protein